MSGEPRGTVSFLFTDLEGSTRLWRDFPNAMPAAYARHDAILRDAITSHGGSVYKFVGDALQAAFPTAPAAVAAALDAQRALQAEPWSACGLPEPLRVRMALHAGAVDPDAGGDYRSPVLNRLGRLLAAAHGGQALLTAAIQGLVWDALPAWADVRDLGEQRLKDLDQPSHLFQLFHPGLQADFPPLRTLEHHPTNLPSLLTAFLGREEEVDAVEGLLRRESVRLVTLTGPGGIGKSRLSVQAGRRLLEEFPDGVWFIELAAIANPDLVLDAIAAPLHVRESGATPLKELLLTELADKHALLILDNFEQVIQAAWTLAVLLAGCPSLKVLVTSRVALHLRGEHEFPVAPLTLPRRFPPPTLEQVTQFEAVRLFIERAQAVRPDFAVDNVTAPAVAEICHRLDGLPLAIELAAARIRLLDPFAMLSRLERRLPLLTGGAKDLPERQRTLRQAIAWSYDLLPLEERALFRCLAVFAGGFTFAAAEAVAAHAPELTQVDVLDGLERLYDQSLLRRMEARDGEPRFGMLETIREFGLEQLGQSATEEAGVRRAHAAHFEGLVLAARHGLSVGNAAAVAQMNTERDNIRSMLASLLEANEPEPAFEVMASLSNYWVFTGGQFSEGRAWLERALDKGGTASSLSRARALSALAMVAAHQADHTTARAAATESLCIARATDNADAAISALYWLSGSSIFEDRVEEALSHTLEALQIARGLDDPGWQGWILWLLGFQRLAAGDLAAARSSLEEGLTLCCQVGDPWCVANSHMVLGLIAGEQGDLTRAAAWHGEALAAFQQLGAGDGIPYSLIGLADIATQCGLPDAGAWLLGAVATHFDRFGHAVPPDLHRRIERTTTAARAQLGEASFLPTLERGKTLATDEAVADAIALAQALAKGAAEPLSA